ncbi:MAG: glycosyltransferase family 4 protein [Muribaculaceae bacterium]
MIFIIITIFLILLELGYFRIADKFNIIDKPNLRSSHSYITLRGGGIIFPLAAIVWTCAFGFQYTWFIVALIAISAISFIDDIHSVPNRIRIVVQFAAMLAVFCQWGIVNTESWWIIIIALITCTGIINAYNFMDGINGITAGYSLAIIVPLLLLNYKIVFVEQSFLIVIALSILIFCFFNFRQHAKCFAGDVGSVSIAFIILFALGALILKTGNIWYIIFLAVYGIDSVLTIAHRLMLHENIFKPHRKHAYQLMANELKIPHTTVSSIYMLLQLIISLGLVYIPINNGIYSAIVFTTLTISYVVFTKRFYYLHVEYLNRVQQ